jgi:D-tyrosyl-tRNA(Tyr) deacylase
MKALLQRVEWAQVELHGVVSGRIGPGLLVYLGVAAGDDAGLAARTAQKVAALRIFDDGQGKLNLSVRDVRGGVLVIPSFTLLGDARRGRRPEFSAAAAPEQAKALYEAFVAELKHQDCTVACGVFGAMMVIRSAANGPVNVIVDLSAAPQAGGGSASAPGGDASEAPESTGDVSETAESTGDVSKAPESTGGAVDPAK